MISLLRTFSNACKAAEWPGGVSGETMPRRGVFWPPYGTPPWAAAGGPYRHGMGRLSEKGSSGASTVFGLLPVPVKTERRFPLRRKGRRRGSDGRRRCAADRKRPEAYRGPEEGCGTSPRIGGFRPDDKGAPYGYSYGETPWRSAFRMRSAKEGKRAGTAEGVMGSRPRAPGSVEPMPRAGARVQPDKATLNRQGE